MMMGERVQGRAPDIVGHQGQERATKDALKFVPKLPCHYFLKINIVIVSFAVIK